MSSTAVTPAEERRCGSFRTFPSRRQACPVRDPDAARYADYARRARPKIKAAPSTLAPSAAAIGGCGIRSAGWRGASGFSQANGLLLSSFGSGPQAAVGAIGAWEVPLRGPALCKGWGQSRTAALPPTRDKTSAAQLDTHLRIVCTRRMGRSVLRRKVRRGGSLPLPAAKAIGWLPQTPDRRASALPDFR